MEELKDHQPSQQLSCPSCKATNFPNLSKLNKHRNSHDKPYKCPALGCYERFAQRQNLDRHTQRKHGDTKNPTKFYHCIVDGCRYSGTDRRSKSFARADQVKEHIKDFGHYGPHSANDRPRRPGQPLFAEHLIMAHFEEWILDGSILPRRTVQSYEYNSLKTKLWHTDDTGELYIRAGADHNLNGSTYWGCPVAACYYQLHPPETLDGTVFKTLEGVQEHHRRAHYIQPLVDSPASQPLIPVQLSETVGITSRSGSIERATLLSDDFLSDTGTEYLASSLQSGDSMDWGTFESAIGDPFNSNQNETTDLKQPIFQSVGDTSQICFPSIPNFPDLTDLHYSRSNFDRIDAGHRISPGTNRSPSLPRTESTVSGNSRISCEIPGCNKNFRRKGDMQRHVESVHRMSICFTCCFCERQFHRKDKVNDHLKNAHKVQPDSTFMKMKSLFTESSTFCGLDIVPGDPFATVTSTELPWKEGSRT